MNIRTTALCLFLGLASATAASAQVSPEEAIKKILQQVETELNEIDRMLLESSRSDAKKGMKEAQEKLQELINGSKDSQGKVVRGIQHLIEELEKMSDESDSSSSEGSGKPQDKPKDGQEPGNQPQSQRQKSESPDMIEQGRKEGEKEGQKGEKPGEKPGEQPDGKNPKDGEQQGKKPGQDPNDPGKNTTKGKAQEGATGKANRKGSKGAWGQLQKYERFIHSRGGLPETSSKYRRLHEAYQKRSQKTKSKKN